MAYLNGGKVLFSSRVIINEGRPGCIQYWESGKEYKKGDIVYKPNLNDGWNLYDEIFKCVVNHTSEDFMVDYMDNSYWEYVKGVEAESAWYAVEAESAYTAGYTDEAGYANEADTAEYANLAGAAECDNEGRIIHETYPTWDDLDSSVSSTALDIYDSLEMVGHFWEYSMEEAEEYLYDATEILLIFKKNGNDKLIYSHYVPFNNDYGYKTVGECAHQKVSIMNDTNAYWYYNGSKICLENADGYTIESIMLKH